MHIEVAWFRLTAGGVEPASLVGVGVGQAGFAGQQRIAGAEGAVDDREQITDGLEALDCAKPAAGGDGLAGFYFEHHFDEFAEHAGGELGEADPPEGALPCGSLTRRRLW